MILLFCLKIQLERFMSNYHKFQDLARREGTKMSPLIMRIIEEYVSQHQEGNPQHLITSSMNDEDFMGFPAMAINAYNKRSYIKKMPEKMRVELLYHVQEWSGMLKEP